MSASASYILPLRWTRPGPIEDLASYLRELRGEVAEILVVDGSPRPLFERHAAAFDGVARHLPPNPNLSFAMGKVNGVITGVRAASHERIVIADDDVRYDREAIRRTIDLLGTADLVRPQNYFEELPWHARWDTARSLLNRVFSGDLQFPVGDFPGTMAVRRSTFVASRAYDGDVLFENLELMRTLRAFGGTVATPLDLYVARRPPSTRHFLSQRVRQAYDDFAMPLRLAGFLSAGPAAVHLLRHRRRRALGAIAATSIAVAELGRRRAGGAERFPVSASLLAPAWLAERSTCAWLALGERLAGGARYGGKRLKRSATPMGRLRRRYRGPADSSSSARPYPLAARKPIVL